MLVAIQFFKPLNGTILIICRLTRGRYINMDMLESNFSVKAIVAALRRKYRNAYGAELC